MLKYTIKILFLLLPFSLLAQEKEKDTTTYKNRYGLRVGIDLFRPAVSFFDDDLSSFEIVGDYRISERFFLATELGYANYKGNEDFYNYTTKGSYIKVGTDFNTYKNWLGMENLIYVGVRYAFSTFDQTVDNYTINADPFLPLETNNTPITYDGLTAQWAELVLGIKAEILHNVFLGFSFRAGKIISDKEPDNFKNLYIPGFNRVYLNNGGFSFNYTLSYLIPLYKK